MCWRGFDGAIAAAQQGHDVVIAHSKFTYLDHYQSEPYLEPLAWAGLVPNGYTTLQKTYSLEPIPPQLTRQEQKHIIGVQANLWLEYIRTTARMDYMTFPRLAALSEVMWTEQNRKIGKILKEEWNYNMRDTKNWVLIIRKVRYNVYFDI